MSIAAFFKHNETAESTHTWTRLKLLLWTPWPIILPHKIMASHLIGCPQYYQAWKESSSGKRGKYRLIPMNSIARAILSRVADDRSADAFVFDKDTNGVNEYWIDKGFEDACDLAGVYVRSG